MTAAVTILALREARVLTVRSDPGIVVLALRSDGETVHFAMTLDDLAALADRLRQDALLLKG